MGFAKFLPVLIAVLRSKPAEGEAICCLSQLADLNKECERELLAMPFLLHGEKQPSLCFITAFRGKRVVCPMWDCW